MPGERKRNSVPDKKSKDDDDDIPIVVNISPSKAARGSPSVKVIPNGSSTSSPASSNCVPQRKAAASAEKSFSSSSLKSDEKKDEKKKESSDDDNSEEEKEEEKKTNGKKKVDDKKKKKKRKGMNDSSDEEESKDEKKAKNGKKKSKDSSDEEEDEDEDDDDDDDDNNNSDSSDSDSKSAKKKGSAKPKAAKVMIDPKTNEAVESMNCTACGKQTPAIKHRIKRHPTLNCLVCRRCHQFYFDGEFERDEDGTEVHCQWCAEGGNVLMCDDCPHVFCRSCLKRNLGRDPMNEIEKADNWKCLVCNPKPVEPLIRECNRVMNKFGESQQEKVNLKLDKVASAIADLDKGVQLWTKFLKNVRGDFKDLEKKKKKKSADEYQKKMTKVGKDVAKVVKSIKTIVTKVEGDLTVSSKPTTNGDDSEYITIEEIVDDGTPVGSSLPKTSSALNASKANANSVSVDVSDISSASSSDDDSDSSSESDDNRRKSGKYNKDPSFSNSKARGKKGDDDEEEEEEEDDGGKEKKEKRAPSVKKKKKGRAGRPQTKPGPTAAKMKRKKPAEKEEEEAKDEDVEKNEKAKRDLLKMMKESSDSDADDEDDEEEEEEEKEKGEKKNKNSEAKMKEDDDEVMEVDSEDEGHDSELEKMIKKWGKKEGKTKWLANKKKTEKKDDKKGEEDVKEEEDEKEAEGKEKKESSGKKKTKSGKSLSGVDLFAEGDTDYEDNGGDDDDDCKVTSTDDVMKKKDDHSEKSSSVDGVKEEKDKPSMDANEAAKNDLKAMMEESDDDDDDEDDDGFKIEDKKKKKEGKGKDEKKKTEGKTGKKEKEKKAEEEEVIVEDEEEEEDGKPKTQTGKYRKGLLSAKITVSDDEEKGKKTDKGKEKEDDAKGKKDDKDKKGKSEKEESDREEVVIESLDEEEEEKEVKTASPGKKGGKGKDKSKKEDEKKKTESDSDSDFISGPKKRNQRKRRRDDDSDVVDLSDGEDSMNREAKKKRKRVKKGTNSSCEEDKISGAEDNDDESPRKRKRKIIKDSKLQEETKAALEAEEARRKRVKDKQQVYNDVRTEEDPSSPVKCPKVTSLVLDRNEKKEPIVLVEASICQNLKPHQVEGIQFMYDCVVESVERVQKGDSGGGSILAHCMGLGKTLQVIALVHTILTHEKLLKFRKILIICPVNVCLNWVDEFIKWVPEDSLDIYEMSSIKDNHKRAEYLQEWQDDGGVMILGYDMFRNLASGSHCRQKKLRDTFEKCLINPGADLIVCDEGHLLKNEATAISKVISTVKTMRRISLTGTPLQNNLIEYHCMVQFVKPNLLGTKKEFLNRFVNPILAGQGKDSSAFDVKLMKQRAHILHEMLDGCVQRRDYTALTKFLPPKHEYVVKVRNSPLQIKLYTEYLDQFVNKKDQPPDEKSKKMGAGGRLFQDYQYLSRIWTHPHCLAIAQRRADIRDQYKWIEESDADSDLMTSSSEDDNASSSEDDSDIICEDGDKKGKKKEKKKSKKSGKKSDGDEEDEEKKKKKEAKKGKKEKKKQEIDEDDKLAGNGKGDSPKKKGGKADRAESPEFTRTGRKRRACTKKEGEDSPPRSPTPPPKEEEYWWTPLVKEACPEEGDLAKPVFSGKMSMLINILRESESVGDKVLVFSQSLSSLDMIEEYLAHEDGLAKEGKLTETTASAIWGWTIDDDYFRMDGGTNCENRQRQMALFNEKENSQARLFLISTRAGSLGTNMVGANRVVVFDASWNPSYDVQSIFRVYRYGQTKPVYIYRLIAQATMEEKIYDRQVNKQSLASRVIDEHQIDRHFNAGELQELYRFEPDRLDDPNRKEPPTPVLPKDRLLADMLTNMADRIYHYHEHDSLLENKVEQNLTEDERKAAWEEFEREKTTGYRQQQPNPQFANFATGAAGAAGMAAGAQGGQPVPINFNGPINQYLMYISQMERSQRMTAEMALMKMIYSANPHLTAGQEGMVYQRMQGIILRYEQTQRQQQQREIQKQQKLRMQQEQEARINAALYNQLGGKTTRLHSPYAQQAYAAQAAQAAHAAGAARQAHTSSGVRHAFHGITPHPQPAPQMNSWETLRSAIIKQIDAKDHSLQMLIPFVYANYPPKDKRRFGEEEMAKFQSLVMDKRPEAKKKVKHLLLKVIQDYHPDKVDADHGEQWKLVSEEISKRLNKYFGELK